MYPVQRSVRYITGDAALLDDEAADKLLVVCGTPPGGRRATNNHHKLCGGVCGPGGVPRLLNYKPSSILSAVKASTRSSLDSQHLLPHGHGDAGAACARGGTAATASNVRPCTAGATHHGCDHDRSATLLVHVPPAVLWKACRRM